MDRPDAANDEVWRLFVAIDLPEDVKQRAVHMRRTLEADGWRARWVRPEALHLSLRFYGDQPVESVPALIERLRSAAHEARSFELNAAGAGIFPNERRPRVIWLGVHDRSGTLTRLATAVERESRAYGIEAETRPFRPHITLARVRPNDSATIHDVQRHLAGFERIGELPFVVDHFSLIQSDLRREGPIYTVIERFELETT
ncbi:MAG TPA: RNA 2',3'-cyclic phosphodiesterase [Nitrolancea sp.]|nr:RNA 2',3'-cyclic phosphodiesterase [Nitrolancea sp.]